MQSKFQYWAQHNYPHDAGLHADSVDQAILAAASVCLGADVIADPVALRRLRLPARMYGGGIRSLVDVAPAAFVGSLCKVVPRLADAHSEDWNIQPGFFNALAAIMPPTPPGGTDGEGRFTALLASGLPLAHVFRNAWAAMQSEIGPDTGDGPLQANIANAGIGVTKLQGALTKQREKSRFNQIDAQIRALPHEDMRRLSWLSTDKNSTVWVSAWPTKESYLSNPEFGEVVSTYFGTPSPACRNLVGQRIGRTNQFLDQYGAKLCAARLPGDGWRTQHDVLKWRITQDAHEMGARCRTEVYGLFAACIPQAGRARALGMPARKRQGLVPDFMMTLPIDGPERELLFELKTLHVGTQTYRDSEHRCEAVARRARALPPEYAGKARTIDQKFCGTTPGNIGPVENKLRAYDPVRGLVFGAWGEGSPDVNRLITALAKIGSTTHWRSMRLPGPAEAHGTLAWLLRRRWAMTAVRENARLKLERLEYVGAGAAAAADRRAASFASAACTVRRAACRFHQGPRIFQGRGDR